MHFKLRERLASRNFTLLSLRLLTGRFYTHFILYKLYNNIVFSYLEFILTAVTVSLSVIILLFMIVSLFQYTIINNVKYLLIFGCSKMRLLVLIHNPLSIYIFHPYFIYFLDKFITQLWKSNLSFNYINF